MYWVNKLKKDRVVFAAVKQDGTAIRWATNKLKKIEVTPTVKQDGSAIYWAGMN